MNKQLLTRLKNFLKYNRVLNPFVIFLRFFMYFFTHKKYWKRFFKSNRKKRFSKIARETFMLWHYWKMFPFHYFRYNLYLEEKSLSKNELISYVPEFYFDWVIIPEKNDIQYISLLSNKIISDRYLKSFKIPLPKTIIYIISNRLVNEDSSPVNNLVFEKNIGDKRLIFVKPVLGRGGDGIKIMKKEELTFDILFLLAKKGDYICQEEIKQHHILSKIYPYSVNTLRVVTKSNNLDFKIIAAILRIGQGGERVDNSNKGGISVELDLSSWRLKEVGYSEHPVDRFLSHPDTNVEFNGILLPYKEEISKLIKRITEIIPSCEYLGMDIAFSINGPIIIEVNPGFGIDHVQISLQKGIKDFLV